MPTDFTLNNFHNLFDQTIVQGFANIQSDVNWIFNFLCVLVIVTTAIMAWAWGDASTAIRGLIQKMLLMGFIALLLNNWHTYSEMIVQGMTSLGLEAGGSSMSVATFWNDPSQVFSDGFTLSQNVWKSCANCNGSALNISTWTSNIVFLIGSLWIMVAFAWLAISVFVATLEFKIVTLAGMMFIPFAIWPKLSFLSERALGYVFSAGAKMLTLALIVSLGEHSLASQNVIPSSDWGTLYCFCGLSAALLFLALSSSKLAAALVSGGPQIGASSALSAAGALTIGTAAGTVRAAQGASQFMEGAMAMAGASALTRYRAAATAANFAPVSNATRSTSQRPTLAGARAFVPPSSVGNQGSGNSGLTFDGPANPLPDGSESDSALFTKRPRDSNSSGSTDGTNDEDSSVSTGGEQSSTRSSASAVTGGSEDSSPLQATDFGSRTNNDAQVSSAAPVSDSNSSLKIVFSGDQNIGDPIADYGRSRSSGGGFPVQAASTRVQNGDGGAASVTAPSGGAPNIPPTTPGIASSFVATMQSGTKSSTSDGEKTNMGKQSYMTGGGSNNAEATIKKISDGLRALEGPEAIGSIGGPNIHG